MTSGSALRPVGLQRTAERGEDAGSPVTWSRSAGRLHVGQDPTTALARFPAGQGNATIGPGTRHQDTAFSDAQGGRSPA